MDLPSSPSLRTRDLSPEESTCTYIKVQYITPMSSRIGLNANEVAMASIDDPRVPEKIKAKVQIQADCWIWTGALNYGGLPRFRVDGSDTTVAKVLLGIFLGESIPTGSRVKSTCSNRACVNPDHLKVGAVVNKAARTHKRGPWKHEACPRGHASTDHAFINDDGKVDCKVCCRIRESLNKKR